MSDTRERTTIVVFVVMSVLAGGNAVGVRFSNRELEPMWGATVRFGLAAAVLFVIMYAMRLPWPRGRALAGAVLYGLFSFGAAFGLAYYGLVKVQAGLGQTLLALAPLATLLLAVAHRQERLHRAAVLGTLVAVAGIAVVSGAAVGEAGHTLSILSLIASALCFGEAAVLAHRFPSVHPVVMNAVGMASGAVFLFGLTLIAGDRIEVPELAETWAAIAFLVAIGSVLVFVLYVFVLQRWEASRASYTFVLIPIFTLVFSAWLDDEPLGAGLLFGVLLVIAGVYIGALRPPPTAQPAPATEV